MEQPKKYIKVSVKASEKYNQYQKSEIGNDVYEEGAFLEGFYDAESQFIEVPDRESELIEMLILALNRLENTTEYEVVDSYKEDCAKIRELIQSVKQPK